MEAPEISEGGSCLRPHSILRHGFSVSATAAGRKEREKAVKSDGREYCSKEGENPGCSAEKKERHRCTVSGCEPRSRASIERGLPPLF